MRVYPSVLIAFFLLTVACGDLSHGDEKFTKRMVGCAESVNGILYVMGGTNLYNDLADVGAYDPSSKTWSAKSSLPLPRSACVSAVLRNDIYLIGGLNKSGVLSDIQKYNTNDDTWLTCAPIPTPRWNFMACQAGNKIYTFGGISGRGTNRNATDVIETYDPIDDSWQQTGSMPGARQSAAIAVVNELIYIISGKIATYHESTKGEQITQRVDCYDPINNTWITVTDIPTGRVSAKAVVAKDKIYVVGGMDKTGKLPTQIDVFDPQTNQWSSSTQLTTGRSGHMCALVKDSIILFGGTSDRYKGGQRPQISSHVETIAIHENQAKSIITNEATQNSSTSY